MVVVVVVVASSVGTTARRPCRVGDQTVSRESVNDELPRLADNQALLLAVDRAGRRQRRTAQLGRRVDRLRWVSLLVVQELADQAVCFLGKCRELLLTRAIVLTVQSIAGVNVVDALPEWIPRPPASTR